METTASIIWNRATTTKIQKSLEAGDIALAAFLRVHGVIMNSGILHAAESLSDKSLDEAVAGYQFFGLNEVRRVLARAKALLRDATELELESQEAILDAEYQSIVPNDAFLFSNFERHLTSNPKHFALVE